MNGSGNTLGVSGAEQEQDFGTNTNDSEVGTGIAIAV